MKKIIFIISTILILTYGLIDVDAKEIDVNGYYGLTKCTEIVSNNSSSIVDCAYFNSYIIDGTNTTYTMLEKAVSDFSGTTSNYSIANSLFLFGYYNFIKDNYYTLNFVYDNGSYIDNNLSLTSLSDLSYGYFLNSDYVNAQGLSDLSYTATYDQNNNQGYISITFKCTQNTSSYRFIINRTPIFRNISFQYNQGIRVYLLNAIEEEDNSNALLGQITNQNNTMINQNQTIINNQTQIKDSLTDDSPPDISGLEDSAGWLPPGPVDTILNLPLTLFNNLITNLSTTCQPIQIPLPYINKNFTLPCISSLYEQIGIQTFLNWVGLVVGTFILYNYFLNLYQWIDNTIQMKDSSISDWGGV